MDKTDTKIKIINAFQSAVEDTKTSLMDVKYDVQDIINIAEHANVPEDKIAVIKKVQRNVAKHGKQHAPASMSYDLKFLHQYLRLLLHHL